MRTSVRWINDYLEPPADAEEQAGLLTRAGLPFDGRETVGDDIRQEIETTSNRGDCLAHVGLAREIAAMSGRRLRTPAASPVASGPDIAAIASVRNDEPGMCPLYTARAILGVTVGPSPAWLADRLTAIGQIPRNNIVDATNFVLFELGQPTHVFDLDTLLGRAIVVRRAAAGERFLPIGEGAAEVRLSPQDLVIADAERAVAIAGVKGGAATAVRDATTNLLLEAATFDPVAVRRTSRRLGIASDSAYRFERGVHPAQVDAAAERLAALILETAGGALCAGALRAGAAPPPPRTVRLRVARCRALLGVELPVERMMAALATLGFAPRLVDAGGGRDAVVECSAPAQRLDIEREIDLIEEVARMTGLDALPVGDTISVRVAPAQPRVAAQRAVRDLLAGMGFVESVTHSLVGDAAAAPFVPAGAAPVRVDDDRARSEPILRPSIVPSLLRVRRHNLDGDASATLDLFEIAHVFNERDGAHRERHALAMVMDRRAADEGLRRLRGAVERVLGALVGGSTTIEVRPAADEVGWLAPTAEIALVGPGGAEPPVVVGRMGPVAPAVLRQFGLDDTGLLAAEIVLDGLLDRYPPETAARALPAYPPIDRDISAVVDDASSWRSIDAAIRGLRLDHLEDVQFVTAFRGRPIAAGRKSVTARLRFRSPDRTLRHDEIDPLVARAMDGLRERLGAEIRS